jgi:hypothetical protein
MKAKKTVKAEILELRKGKSSIACRFSSAVFEGRGRGKE